MIDLNKINCTGCSSCYNGCPVGAIKMVSNEKGFLYPHIDETKCIQCELCVKICGAENKVVYDVPVHTYAVKHKALEERMKSQSGGAAYVLSKHIIEVGGVVYGAIIDKDFSVCHSRAETIEELEKFRGSKYVQSDLKNMFSFVREDLNGGRTVLFTGTPCQIAGLKSFLVKDYDKLYTVDVICHGVPSPRVWSDYLKWQENCHNKELKKVFCRDLTLKWGASNEALYFRNDKRLYNIYAKIFYSRNAFRDSCFECSFANLKRQSDITVGDYWGIDLVSPEFKDDYGISAVIINSKKGNGLFASVSSELDILETTTDQMTRKNPQLLKSADKPASVDKFWEEYHNNTFAYIAKKYGGNSIKGKIKRIVKRALGR